jgi:hypothetical protein
MVELYSQTYDCPINFFTHPLILTLTQLEAINRPDIV